MSRPMISGTRERADQPDAAFKSRHTSRDPPVLPRGVTSGKRARAMITRYEASGSIIVICSNNVGTMLTSSRRDAKSRFASCSARRIIFRQRKREIIEGPKLIASRIGRTAQSLNVIEEVRARLA